MNQAEAKIWETLRKEFDDHMFQLIQVMRRFVPSFSKLNEINISWKMDVTIDVDRHGVNSPFSLVMNSHYDIIGYECPKKHQKLVDLAFGWFFDKAYESWSEKQRKISAIGWDNNSIFGNFVATKNDQGSFKGAAAINARCGLEQKTIAVILVKNCDLTISKIIESVARTTDYQLILDDNSTDNTVKIVKQLYDLYPGLILRDKILGMSDSGRYVKPLLNTRTNVWKVDGDEFWAPRHVSVIRSILRSNEWRDTTNVKFKQSRIDVYDVDQSLNIAHGHAADHEGLYNFANILEWAQLNERLHAFDKATCREGCASLQVEGYGVIMAHFPFLNMSLAPVNSFGADITRFKNNKYSKDNTKKEILISLLEFDCEREIQKANIREDLL